MRPTPKGLTSLSISCPAHVLPQLVLLDISEAPNANRHTRPSAIALHNASPMASSPIVRSGATLRADLRTDSMHAPLNVIAMESGAAGSEIRVRAPKSTRVLRDLILTAHTATIIMAGA